MPARTSKDVWNGDLQSGTGQMVVGNNAYTGDFSFKSRFEEGAGTNPEELIAAAHAGCYSMQLSAMLANAEKNPDQRRNHRARDPRDGRRHTDDHQDRARHGRDRAGRSSEEFAQFAQDAKAACLITRALAGVENVTLTARLED